MTGVNHTEIAAIIDHIEANPDKDPADTPAVTA